MWINVAIIILWIITMAYLGCVCYQLDRAIADCEFYYNTLILIGKLLNGEEYSQEEINELLKDLEEGDEEDAE